MDGSLTHERYGSIDGSDESSLSDLSSPREVPDGFEEPASVKENGESREEPPSADDILEVMAGTPLPASTPESPLTDPLDTPETPTQDCSHASLSVQIAEAMNGGDEADADISAEQTPATTHAAFTASAGEALTTVTPASGAHEEPSPDSRAKSHEDEDHGASRNPTEELISERDERSTKTPSPPTVESEERPTNTEPKEPVEDLPQEASDGFAEPSPAPDKRERSQSAIQPSCSQDELQNAASSSLSTVTDISEPPSAPSAVSSQATTPADAGISLPAAVPPSPTAPTPSTPTATLHTRLSLQLSLSQGDLPHPPQLHSLPASPLKRSPSKRSPYKVRPKASIPLDLTLQEYARQCVAAAESSRLNPYALHEEEHAILRHHISHAQVTTYLNIRNGILRLWLRKPHIAITRNEAIGCAKDSRWFDVASVCFDWLVRRGYVNFGCVEIKGPHKDKSASASNPSAAPESHGISAPHKRRKRIVVIGAGMAGLGCARQLHNLFKQYGDRFGELGVELPEVVVLEGRDRIGGRVYSRPFQIQPGPRHPDFQQSRCTAEMGGMIITGFDRGNPMNILVRGQLGLGYHALLSTTTLYDINSKPVDTARDGMVENLFNECLDRVSEYKFKAPMPRVIEGSRGHMDEGRDSSSEGHRTIASIEDAATAQLVAAAGGAVVAAEEKAATNAPGAPEAALQSSPVLKTELSAQVDLVPVSSDRLTGRAHLEPGTLATLKAAHKVRIMGWELKPGVTESRDLDLDAVAKTAGATLGVVVEEAIKQYGELVDLNAQDFRLLNWHIANLEYSNAINHNCLSLLGWDIDAGNEWEGKHSMIIGGYQSVPRGLMLCPTPLDVRRQHAVKKITYNVSEDNNYATNVETGEPPVVIECESGDAFEADYVVNTIPLGVLKHGNVEFNPPLPAWKANSIGRLGYGVLNKIILTYRQPFWDPERDIFGVLREPANRFSLNQREYSQRRGRMFQWFNVSKTTGIPCLVALMAGDAAFDTEKASNDELVSEATSVLRNVFGAKNVPVPIEAVVTRWASDTFARGSYSSAGPDMKIDDYDMMARPVGKHLYFAGEHTIGTHPATVHGAYLSGLRAASEIFEELLGAIEVPTPLVLPKETMPSVAIKRKLTLDDEEGPGGDESSGSISASGSGSGCRNTKASSRKRLEAREMRIQEHIRSQIGNRPARPQRVIDTSYLLFSKANYERARRKCEEGRRPGKGRPLPNEVRVLTSKMWRSASAEERRPFAEQAAAQKQIYEAALEEHNAKAAEWDQRAAEVRAAYEKEHSENGELGAAATPQNASPSARGSAAATPDRPSPYGGRRLRRMTSYQAGDDSDVDMTG